MSQTCQPIRAYSPHPLDPLSSKELTLAVEIIREQAQLDSRALFEQVRLKEPEKSLVRQFVAGNYIEREVFAVILDRNADKVYEASVCLNDATLQSYTWVPGVRVCMLAEENAEMQVVVRQHPDFVAGLKRRGIENIQQVLVEAFAVANLAEPDEKDLRHTRAHCFYVENPGDNTYARPIEGLVPVVDLNAMTVLRVEDSGVVPLPPDPGDYRADRLEVRPALAALNIVQPDGPDFKVDGYAVHWQNWQFRVGFTPKEGLILHTLSFRDGETDRPVIYRASLSELVVPYGDTAGDHYMNHSFDLGETIFGAQANSLQLGCDCLGEIHYFDFDQVDGNGNVRHFSKVVCMHEEDYGILWKHTDVGADHSEIRRSRRLVVSSFFTIGNYDYGLFWYLYLDGTIEFEAKLTKRDGETIKVGNEGESKVVLDAVANEPFIVDKIAKKERKKSAAPPFITSKLQQASKMPVKRTMMIAQQLYEGIELPGEGAVGLITYMRTDSTRTSAAARQEVRSYIEQEWDASHVGRGVGDGNGKGVQDAHEAIRPTRPQTREPQGLEAEQTRLYALIWARFAASQMAPSQWQRLKLAGETGGWNAAGKTEWRTFAGWEAAYTKLTKPVPQASPLTGAAEGDTLALDEYELIEDETKPPGRYTQHGLVAKMKAEGIGRPSTYAETIRKLLDRKYARD